MKVPYLKKNRKYILKPFLQKKERDKLITRAWKVISEEEYWQKKYQEIVSPKPFYKEYDCLNFFVEGLAQATIKGKLTYIDFNEKPVPLSNNYITLNDFKNGVAKAKKDDGLWYLINKNGVAITNEGYEAIDYDEFGIYTASTFDGNSVLLDKSGNQINIDDINRSSNKKAIKYTQIGPNIILILYSDQTYRGLNFDGVELFKTTTFTFISNFYGKHSIAITKEDSKVVIIDDTLNFIKVLENVEEKEIDGLGFIDGYAMVNRKNNKCLLTLNGVLSKEYSEINRNKEGFFRVGKIINGKMKYAFINSDFKEITLFKYDLLNDFSENIASFKIDNKFGLLNSLGTEILSPEYAYIGDCVNGFIPVSYGDYRARNYGSLEVNLYYGKFGFLNKDGRKICPIIYDSVSCFDHNKLAKVKLNGFYGLLNEHGQEVTKVQYDSIDECFDNCYFVRFCEDRFIIDETGYQFTEEEFDRDLEESGRIFDLPF